MAKRMLIDATHPEETRVVVLNGNRLEEFDFETSTKKQVKGNIYLAKVTRVEPSLQAAFVEYGGNRHGFLAFSEIHPDYYRIPVADRRFSDGDLPVTDSQLKESFTEAEAGDDGGVPIEAALPEPVAVATAESGGTEFDDAEAQPTDEPLGEPLPPGSEPPAAASAGPRADTSAAAEPPPSSAAIAAGARDAALSGPQAGSADSLVVEWVELPAGGEERPAAQFGAEAPTPNQATAYDQEAAAV